MFRTYALIGIAALGIVSAATAHALPEGWYRPRPSSPYVCRGNHIADSATYTLATYIAGPTDIRWCEALCTTSPHCVAFTFIRRVDPATGREHNYCQLLSSGADPMKRFTPSNRFEWAAACYNRDKTDEYDKIELQDAVRRYHQDSYRPGAPGSGAPSSRYRP